MKCFPVEQANLVTNMVIYRKPMYQMSLLTWTQNNRLIIMAVLERDKHDPSPHTSNQSPQQPHPQSQPMHPSNSIRQSDFSAPWRMSFEIMNVYSWPCRKTCFVSLFSSPHTPTNPHDNYVHPRPTSHRTFSILSLSQFLPENDGQTDGRTLVEL